MKIRNGFVSNSSSSSFVILGVKYDNNDTDELWEDIWNWGDGDLRAICDDGTYYKGLVIGESQYDAMDENEFTRTEIANAAQAIAETLGVTLDEIKIYTGTRSC